MRPNRVIKLPVFRTMFQPVAQKAWVCNICKQPVEIGRRYVHYIDRRTHEIINYRFHSECFGLVEAYCKAKGKTSFTPTTARNWAKKTFCDMCKEQCPYPRCKGIESAVKTILKGIKKVEMNT